MRRRRELQVLKLIVEGNTSSQVGTLLGRAFYAFDGAHRRLAIGNLLASFPFRSAPECRAIAKQMFSHFGRLLMALLKFSTMSRERMLEHVEFEGEERVVAAHKQGKGVLLFTGHFGFWEINALVHALAIQPMAVLARPLDNPLLHELLDEIGIPLTPVRLKCALLGLSTLKLALHKAKGTPLPEEWAGASSDLELK